MKGSMPVWFYVSNDGNYINVHNTGPSVKMDNDVNYAGPYVIEFEMPGSVVEEAQARKDAIMIEGTLRKPETIKGKAKRA